MRVVLQMRRPWRNGYRRYVNEQVGDFSLREAEYLLSTRKAIVLPGSEKELLARLNHAINSDSLGQNDYARAVAIKCRLELEQL